MNIFSTNNQKAKSVFSRGLTLVELLVVISIISFLSSTVFAATKYARAKAVDSAQVATAKTFHTAVESYISDKGVAPVPEGINFSYNTAYYSKFEGENDGKFEAVVSLLQSEGYLESNFKVPNPSSRIGYIAFDPETSDTPGMTAVLAARVLGQGTTNGDEGTCRFNSVEQNNSNSEQNNNGGPVAQAIFDRSSNSFATKEQIRNRAKDSKIFNNVAAVVGGVGQQTELGIDEGQAQLQQGQQSYSYQLIEEESASNGDQETGETSAVVTEENLSSQVKQPALETGAVKGGSKTGVDATQTATQINDEETGGDTGGSNNNGNSGNNNNGNTNLNNNGALNPGGNTGGIQQNETAEDEVMINFDDDEENGNNGNNGNNGDDDEDPNTDTERPRCSDQIDNTSYCLCSSS